MKKIAQNFLTAIGLVSMGVAGFFFVLPFIDAEGVVTEGSFREVTIGASRSDIAAILAGASSQKRSNLKLTGYVDENGDYMPLQIIECDRGKLADADRWYLTYPGFFQERVELVFDNDYLESIRYTRAPFDP